MLPDNYKMLIFDLDGTLSPIGKGVRAEDIDLLHELQKAGKQLVICSGKSTFYLSGMVRQMGLSDLILIGENGCVFLFGEKLPPEKYYIHPCPQEAFAQISYMKELINAACAGHVWYQPNEVALTAFPSDPETFDVIRQLVDDNRQRISALTVYRHIDSFDFVPAGISKYSALAYLSELTGVQADEMIAFGDGVNDLPMFDYTAGQVIIGDKLEYPGALRFTNISEALRYIGSKHT